MRQPTSVGRELLWLLAFLAIFFVLTFLVLRFLVAYQHFNDRIAVMLCAIVSGLIWIALRAANTRRA